MMVDGEEDCAFVGVVVVAGVAVELALAELEATLSSRRGINQMLSLIHI